MKENTLVGIVLVVILVTVAAIFGYRRYTDRVRAEADKAGAQCLRTYYKEAGDGSPDVAACEELRRVLAEMEEVSKKCSPDMARMLFERRLDGAFLIGEYEKAANLIDELPDYSETWKSGAKAKIRAHAALKNGDKATALEQFVVFVETLVKDENAKGEADPCTGITWTKNGLLARNKKRMSELAADIGNTNLSASLRAEAKAHYLAAIDEAEKNTDPDAKAELEKDAGDLLK